MIAIVNKSRYSLGAEELLELGRTAHGARLGNVPFFSSRLGSPRLGDIFSDVGGFITGALGFAINTLGDLVSLPLDILSKGVDVAFTGLANLLDNIPIMGPFLGQILLLGNAVIKFALSVPGLLLHGLGGILTNISKVLTAKNTPAQNQKNVDKAKENIASKAPALIQSAVKSTLDSTGVSGNNLTPSLTPGATAPAPVASEGTDVVKALTIGIPAAGLAAVLVMLSR